MSNKPRHEAACVSSRAARRGGPNARPSRWVLALRALRHCRRGVSAVEFALVVPVIVVIVLGTYDVGTVVQQDIKLAEAAHAGGLYATYYPADAAGIAAAVTTALQSTGWGDISVSCNGGACDGSSPPVCKCWTGTGADQESLPGCTDSCPTPQRYLTIGVSRPYSPLSPFLAGLLPTPSATYVARVQ